MLCIGSERAILLPHGVRYWSHNPNKIETDKIGGFGQRFWREKDAE
jgi:hypothetical protein